MTQALYPPGYRRVKRYHRKNSMIAASLRHGYNGHRIGRGAV